MPDADELTPQEASAIASNVYFTLKDWLINRPVAGAESLPMVSNIVTGTGVMTQGRPSGNFKIPSIAGTALQTQGARVSGMFNASTGWLGVTSGFGYVLTYRTPSQENHCVIALRGTRPEMAWKPDLLTDLRAGMTSFGSIGTVHVGFKKTFESIISYLEQSPEVANANVIHCVGHSLGGGVATLVAATYKLKGKNVKLYTFGCPRVGAMGTHLAIEALLQKNNIYRVSHDLDPITMIGPFPYVHCNGNRTDENNMTMPSPRSLSLDNHDMGAYINSIATRSWQQVRRRREEVDFENCVLAKMLLHGDESPSWLKCASASALTILFKLLDS